MMGAMSLILSGLLVSSPKQFFNVLKGEYPIVRINHVEPKDAETLDIETSELEGQIWAPYCQDGLCDANENKFPWKDTRVWDMTNFFGYDCYRIIVYKGTDNPPKIYEISFKNELMSFIERSHEYPNKIKADLIHEVRRK